MIFDLRLTIITATYNCLDDLKKNYLTSPLFDRDKRIIEWIVVDGGSSDGTTEFLLGLGDLVDVLIVEPDQGIYDAWNKALVRASGKFITFIGADDEITHEYLRVIQNLHDLDYNVICFKQKIVSESGEFRIIHDGIYKKPWNYPVNLGFFHTGTLLRKDLFFEYIFDSTFRIVADQDHLTHKYQSLNIYFFPSKEPLLSFYLGGISNNKNNSILIINERIKLYKRHFQKSIFYIIPLFFLIFLMLFIRVKNIFK